MATHILKATWYYYSNSTMNSFEESTLKDHIEYQKNNYTSYVANLLIVMFKQTTGLSIIKKARILTAALTRLDIKLVQFLFDNFNYTMPEVLKACEILDSRRNIAALNKKLEKVKNKNKISKIKSIIANTSNLQEDLHLSLSKRKIELIKIYWIRKLTATELENYTIQYPPWYWKRLIDLMHLRPDDFALSWFSSYIFTGECPESSLAYQCKNVNAENIVGVVTKYKPSFNYLKAHCEKLLTKEVKKIVCEYTSLDDILTNWKNYFADADVTELVIMRLNNNDKLEMSYGELIKKIQCLYDANKPLADILISEAEKRLLDYELQIEQPVVILGDASGSMSVAIKTSSIIMSVLCKICNAEMNLFRDTNETITTLPRSVVDVITMSNNYKAYGATSPAASLYPYLAENKVVKTFIVVTDEEENLGYNGSGVYDDSFFDAVFEKYYKTVYPAKLVFVSFVPDNKDGFMVSCLKKKINGIEKDIIQFRLNRNSPDLRKLDTMLEVLSRGHNYNDIYNDLLESIANVDDKLEAGKAKLLYESNDNLSDVVYI
jgi:hypothetical protein